MRTKEQIMEQAEGSKVELSDRGLEVEYAPSGLAMAYLEVLIDIRDILALLNNKIPVVRKAGTPGSPPPPEVR